MRHSLGMLIWADSKISKVSCRARAKHSQIKVESAATPGCTTYRLRLIPWTHSPWTFMRGLTSADASLLDCSVLFLGRAHFAWSIPSLGIGTNKLNSQWLYCWKTQPHLSNSRASDPMKSQRGIFVSQR